MRVIIEQTRSRAHWAVKACRSGSHFPLFTTDTKEKALQWVAEQGHVIKRAGNKCEGKKRLKKQLEALS